MMTSQLLSFFLLALLHAATAWDASNVWFPDRNNPVFYNMTYYQEAKKAVEQSVQAQAARPDEPVRMRPTWNRLASDRQQQQQQQEGVKGWRITAQDRQDQSTQDDRIGYKTAPLEDNNASQLKEMFVRNHKLGRQPSSNRLQRRDYADQVGYRSGGEQQSERDVRQSSVSGVANQARRQWRNGGAPAGNEASNTVEGNIISAIETTSKSSRPSKCVWAIISCCRPTSPNIRYMCFETLGCHGAFWDNNPCSKEMTLAAVQATATFYNVPTTDE